MSGRFLHTVGDVSQIEAAIQGDFLKGQREPRVAMVGRSNVGKSSLINALLSGSFAQVSKQPGKTRCIHFYFWQEARVIVADLPGYGYARAGHEERERWAQFIDGYIKADPRLGLALVLLDSRHGPTDLDEQAIEFLKSESIPVNFVMTKFDSLKTQSERASRKKEVQAALAKLGMEHCPVHWVSAKSKDGLKKLADQLAKGSFA
jgi:GTP-binding protein